MPNHTHVYDFVDQIEPKRRPERDGDSGENPTKEIDRPRAENGPRKPLVYFRQIVTESKSLVTDGQRGQVCLEVPASFPIIEIRAVGAIGACVFLRQRSQLSAGRSRCLECAANAQKVDIAQDGEA